ncbi:MAG TPA: winged helix-turn-helix domain-containing protein, partial [Pyrinomonadaceae bacterium]|nr:winged helix-turn-helix domain-containing protein [Pyrinomonadaceae bacterium]
MFFTDNFIYEFGPFQLDFGTRLLTRDGETIPLTPKATEILMILVMNAGELVEKDALLRRVWPDTFVEEAN